MQSASDQPIPARFALPVLAGSLLALGVSSMSVVGLLDPMVRDLEVSPSKIAFLVTAFALTYAVTAPLLQIFVGDWDRRRLVCIGLVGIAIGSFLCALTWSYPVLMAARVLTAVGASAIGPMAAAAGASLVPPERRGAALGIVFGGLTIAMVLGVPLSSLGGQLFGWRPVMALIGVMSLGVLGLTLALVPAGSKGQRTTPATLLAVLTDRMLAPSIAVTFFQMAAQFVTYALIAVYLTENFGVAAGFIPVILLIYGSGGVIGNIVVTRVVDRVGYNTMIATSLSVVTVLFVAFEFIPRTQTWAIGLMILWAVFAMILFAPQQARLVTLSPQHGNLLLALNASALYVGMASGSALSGILYDWAGSAHLALPSAALVFMSLLSFLYSRHAERNTGGPAREPEPSSKQG